jgi:hypothetical protein
MWFRFARLLAAAALFARAQMPIIPDTPAGHALQSWLDAINSGDRQHWKAGSDVPFWAFRAQTGGFDLLGIESSAPLRIEFRVKEKASTTVAIGSIELRSADPPVIADFDLKAIPPGLTTADMNPKIDHGVRARVIEGAIRYLNEYYVYPDVARKMDAAIRAHDRNHDYDNVERAAMLARVLTEHLRDVSHDRHLAVTFSPVVLPGREGAPPDAETQAQIRREIERNNCFFEKVEHLNGNVGYLKFNAFPDPALCASTASAAMNFLANVDALIVDLRENGGGDPRMVQYICTYLFDESTHLNDLYNRQQDSTTEYWTLPSVPGKRLGVKPPVFILTSANTFSGAEEFAYNLKNLKRATIVGENTGGGAHPVTSHRIDDHFLIAVPFARAVNPISKTNWEGSGVEPDVRVSAAEALDTAKKLAKKLH